MKAKIRKGVIPAAGLGTRFLPATKAVPKELLPIVDIPTIQYIVEEAVASGLEEIILITARGKGGIEDHFDVSVELEETLKKQKKNELWPLPAPCPWRPGLPPGARRPCRSRRKRRRRRRSSPA